MYPRDADRSVDHLLKTPTWPSMAKADQRARGGFFDPEMDVRAHARARARAPLLGAR